MKFSEFKYERPDYELMKEKYTSLLDRLEKAEDKETFIDIFYEIQKLDTIVSTQANISNIRHSINTKDEFYDAENDYWDEHFPLYDVFSTRLGKICVECPFKEELYDRIPEVFFKLAECQIKSFDEKIIPLLQEENRLNSEYNKLRATAEIIYDGNTYNLSTIYPLTLSTDRKVRKESNEAVIKFYEDNEAEFDRIYDELVKVRTKIANELGYKTFTEVGYLRMTRIDYDAEMVANYRRQILEYVVPYNNKLYARQAKRLGLDKLEYYDISTEFADGNPAPKGTYEEMLDAASKMYHEMSEETGSFIDMMMDGELFDLKSRDGKEMGGYCSSVAAYKVPFIFANFNGTSGDVDVLTHEAGHAFQYYMSRDIPINSLLWPTSESAEISSMSMEFNAWPWMDLFFKEDADKYRFKHLGSALKFLPYGILIDHFQHEVYDHPEMTPDERKACFRRLEKMYLPQTDYSEAPFLEKGTYWYRQLHIFIVPFYYVDYTLAEVCALQFWARNHAGDRDAWKDYLALASLGGTRSFTGLLEAAHLQKPFDDGALENTMKEVTAYLDSVDDSKF
ncbi:MAG: M3 family oligoendopeptidase [Lachnospiraceae bacterium]|nr:M3 family oligoendopeptidase [Lachnospiraceae bacterium]